MATWHGCLLLTLVFLVLSCPSLRGLRNEGVVRVVRTALVPYVNTTWTRRNTKLGTLYKSLDSSARINYVGSSLNVKNSTHFIRLLIIASTISSNVRSQSHHDNSNRLRKSSVSTFLDKSIPIDKYSRKPESKTVINWFNYAIDSPKKSRKLDTLKDFIHASTASGNLKALFLGGPFRSLPDLTSKSGNSSRQPHRKHKGAKQYKNHSLKWAPLIHRQNHTPPTPQTTYTNPSEIVNGNLSLGDIRQNSIQTNRSAAGKTSGYHHFRLLSPSGELEPELDFSSLSSSQFSEQSRIPRKNAFPVRDAQRLRYRRSPSSVIDKAGSKNSSPDLPNVTRASGSFSTFSTSSTIIPPTTSRSINITEDVTNNEASYERDANDFTSGLKGQEHNGSVTADYGVVVKRFEQTTSWPPDYKGFFDDSLWAENEKSVSRKTLKIGGLFELNGKKYGGNGYSELDAALLAVSHINDLEVIPGYNLDLVYNDSMCDPGVGTDAFFDFIYRKSKDSSLVMVMGSACTEVTKTIAEIVPYWNLLLISYAAKSAALSEREKYRTFFRLALGDSALNPARRMLVKHFQWNKVAALYEDLETLSLAFNGINEDFSAHGIVIKSSASFKDAQLEVPVKLKELRDLDVRIILAGFMEPAARQVFCEAYKQGMYGARYVWILVGGFKHQWWRETLDTDCTPAQLATAVEGAFSVFSLDGLLDGGKSVANLTSTEFLEAYFKSNGSRPLSMYAASTYDTVWTIALTIQETLRRWGANGTAAPPFHQLSYENMGSVKETFISTMENLEFPGVSGPVSFKGSDREGIAVVYQVQGGNFTPVAMHQPTRAFLDFDCDSCHNIFWQGGRVPKDEKVVLLRLKTIEVSVVYTATGLCVGGVVLAVFFLAYNLYHRRLKFIKLSSPMLNNVAVIGCILVYTGVILLGLDDRVLTDYIFPIVCSGRAFFLAAGFSLAFGAMFAKTFRVHQIFTRAHHGLVKSKLIQDTHLLVIIGVLLAVDSALVFVWVIVDPMSRHVSNTTTEVSADDEDLIFQDQLTTCRSEHLQKWLGAFYAYKGLLLVFGVYMAWETRHVKIPALNDSQYIGLNVYNVVIMSVSVVVISNILSSQPTLAYTMEAFFMFLSTTVTLCLLFVPKIYAIVTSGGNPVIASTGILVDQTNCRRFVFDDRKEIYYRGEVQNRVYKRELVELDQKLVRLERLLELPLQPYPRLTEELLYLLPESKVDGTPPCHRRYKWELERCNSISDGGEGVTFDVSENEDILMDMAFTSGGLLRPSNSISKRHSVENSRPAVRTFQKLTRSFSIGGASGSWNKKKGRDVCSGASKLPSSVSDSNWLTNHRMICEFEMDGYRTSGGDVWGTRRKRTSDRKEKQDGGLKNECGSSDNHQRPNKRYSDDLTYLQKETVFNFPMSATNRGNTASIPMLDKITQTSGESGPEKLAQNGLERVRKTTHCHSAQSITAGEKGNRRGEMNSLRNMDGDTFSFNSQSNSRGDSCAEKGHTENKTLNTVDVAEYGGGYGKIGVANEKGVSKEHSFVNNRGVVETRKSSGDNTVADLYNANDGSETSQAKSPTGFNSKVGRLFAVHRLQVITVDDDSSASNNENDDDDENVHNSETMNTEASCLLRNSSSSDNTLNGKDSEGDLLCPFEKSLNCPHRPQVPSGGKSNDTVRKENVPNGDGNVCAHFVPAFERMSVFERPSSDSELLNEVPPPFFHHHHKRSLVLPHHDADVHTPLLATEESADSASHHHHHHHRDIVPQHFQPRLRSISTSERPAFNNTVGDNSALHLCGDWIEPGHRSGDSSPEQLNPAPPHSTCLNPFFVHYDPRTSASSDSVFLHDDPREDNDSLPSATSPLLPSTHRSQFSSTLDKPVTCRSSSSRAIPSQAAPPISPPERTSYRHGLLASLLQSSPPSSSSSPPLCCSPPSSPQKKLLPQPSSPSSSLSSTSSSKLSYFQSRENATKMRQVHPSEGTVSSLPLSYMMPPSTKVGSLDSLFVEEEGASPSLPSGAITILKGTSTISNAHYGKPSKTNKSNAESEKKKRIKKLQDDLIRIQRELEDLTQPETDVSEV
ncbi:uncharacterized protein LOC101854281 [Aplysia californica]|uniref:Uncharacterized protein LOC101854281 n=1 Tax=Aplysia californica TaxID=6500 RepID=A0ABM1W0D3_APLCA|nr:uncharacterized protein LOC101854281 [Aplysia californica]